MPQVHCAARLLVSVGSATEAAAALAGGADVIDVKEPARGPLGRADDATIAAVVQCVAGRRPVSAALGELPPRAVLATLPGLQFVKYGLAGWGATNEWQEILSGLYRLEDPEALNSCRLAAVAYADWRTAAAPSTEQVCAFVRQRGSVLLFDTFEKTPGTTLLDHMPLGEIGALCRWCQEAGVQVALAGSLGRAEIATLKAVGPDWFAVRGAACAGGQREAAIRASKVGELSDLIKGPKREGTGSASLMCQSPFF